MQWFAKRKENKNEAASKHIIMKQTMNTYGMERLQGFPVNIKRKMADMSLFSNMRTRNCSTNEDFAVHENSNGLFSENVNIQNEICHK